MSQVTGRSRSRRQSIPNPMLNVFPLHIVHMAMTQLICAHYAAISTVLLVQLLRIPLFRLISSRVPWNNLISN
jgi:hypothetical protein